MGIRLVATDKDYIISSFGRNNVYENLPDADERASNLLEYLGGDEELNPLYYNPNEITHMDDVRHILDSSNGFLCLCVFVLIMAPVMLTLASEKAILAKGLVYGSLASLAVIFLLFIVSINFDCFFLDFHKIFFSNNLWLMVPGRDLLITMFPQAFFHSALLRIFIISLAYSICMLFIGLVIRGRNVRP